MSSFIELRNCYKVYKNGVTALAGVDLEIKKGEFVFVIGSSGSGKSSLIKLLYREEKPTRGEVFVGGLNVAKLRNRKVYKLRRKIGIVFQDFKLLPKLTVYENVAFALETMGLKDSEIRPKVIDALTLVGLKDKIRCFPNQLSGGEQQRVSLARAIVNNPSVLIADEPTGNLDPDTAAEIMKVLMDINNRGTTIIMATHAKEIVDTMKKRVIALENGRMVRDEEKGGYNIEIPNL